jgi:hypothetical protein
VSLLTGRLLGEGYSPLRTAPEAFVTAVALVLTGLTVAVTHARIAFVSAGPARPWLTQAILIALFLQTGLTALISASLAGFTISGYLTDPADGLAAEYLGDALGTVVSFATAWVAMILLLQASLPGDVQRCKHESRHRDDWLRYRIDDRQPSEILTD